MGKFNRYKLKRVEKPMIHQPGGHALGLAGYMQVVCNCGFPVPLMVPFMGAQSPQLECPKCGTGFMVARIDYDAQKGEMKLGIGVKPKDVQLATTQDLKELDQHASKLGVKTN